MKNSNHLRQAILFSFSLLALLSLAHPSPPADTAEEPLVVFLVRHAEKVDEGEDPELNAAGRERAGVLAGILRDAGIGHVHSSDFIRTRNTASPTAAVFGLELEIYDPGDLVSLVEHLRATGGRHLVVGHSNTTPGVVELLGGTPGSEIDEPGEFDWLYVVTISAGGEASTVLMRYGDPFEPK